MALTDIEYGSIATSKLLNDNFHYLDNKISSYSETANTIEGTLTTVIQSQGDTLNSKLTEELAKVNEAIAGVQADVDDAKTTYDKFTTKDVFALFTPDYTKGVDAGATFTAPSYGVVMITFNLNNSSCYITVNGNNVARYADGDGVSGAVNQSYTIPVAKGDVVKRSAGDTKFSRFFPYKGQK
jgi:hypothetical protein